MGLEHGSIYIFEKVQAHLDAKEGGGKQIEISLKPMKHSAKLKQCHKFRQKSLRKQV